MVWWGLRCAVGFGMAQQTPHVQLTAVLRDDLQSITGELRVDDGAGLRWVDVLSQMPDPEDDLTAHRTWPAGAEQGWLHLDALGEGHWSFYAVLPRRYGAAGVVPGRGLFANGLWHPQPMRGSTVASVAWDVTLDLPEGVVAALNTTHGTGQVHWTGEAERLSLAAIPGGQIRVLETPEGTITVLDHRSRPRFDTRLTAILEERWPNPLVSDVRVVVSPLRRRLARPGAGLVYLSDRTFRVNGPLWTYHVRPVRLGVLSSCLPISDPWLRKLAAAAILSEEDAPPELSDALGWFSWIPEVDAIIYDGQMPFFSDVFAEVWPGDVLADDLQEVLDRQSPGPAMIPRIDAIYGEGTSIRLAERLLAGRSLHQATIAAGVPPVVLEEWKRWPPAQDFSLSVEENAGIWQLNVRRETTRDAPMEPVVVEVDSVRRRVNLGPGPDQTQITQPFRPNTVRIDPDGVLLQTARANDRWPNRWTTTVAFVPIELSVRQARFSGALDLGFRKQFNTRWRYALSAYTDPQNRVGGRASALRYLGPLLDRRYRPWRLWGGIGGALLDEAFRPTDQGAIAIEAFGGVAWDTRYVNNLARSGRRLSATGSLGLIPESDERWASTQLTALQLVPLTGRLTLGLRGKGGLSTGQVEHRLLNLGGSGAVQGLPFDNATLGNQRAVGSAELRWMAIKHASVPLPLMWASDMQLSLGIDGGWIRREQDNLTDTAAGWSLGAAFVADILGADPNFGGVWIAGPLYPQGTTSLNDIQLYIRIAQTF